MQLLGAVDFDGSPANEGKGIKNATIRNFLRFDAWYGTQAVKDNTIGVFRPGTQQWMLDNGNGKLDTCNPTATKNKDACLGPFGQSTDVPVVGRWDNTTRKIGVFRNGTWYLDYNGDGIFNTGDLTISFLAYQQGDLPIAGDFGNNGWDTLGIFRSGTWMADYHGNFFCDGCATDRCWTCGQAGDQPVVGRWSNTVWEIGTFRDGTWKLDYNNNHVLDGTGDLIVTGFGGPGDKPVVGDWSGTGWSKIGVFQSFNGQGIWGLDGDGLFSFSGCAIDMCLTFGNATDLPVIYKKSVVRAN